MNDDEVIDLLADALVEGGHLALALAVVDYETLRDLAAARFTAGGRRVVIEHGKKFLSVWCLDPVQRSKFRLAKVQISSPAKFASDSQIA